MGRYFNWVPTIKCPCLEKQVIKDLEKYFQPSKEVLDRLAGREEDEEVFDILNDYKEYIANETVEDTARSLSNQLSNALGEGLVPIIKRWINPRPMNLYPMRKGTIIPNLGEKLVFNLTKERKQKRAIRENDA